MKDGCPFCDYAGPKSVLCDFGDCIVIEPINPVTPGHVLVIPKRHVPHALYDPGLTGEVMFVAASWTRDRGYDCNLITSVGEAATQTVKHLHVHVVPRHPSDGLALPWASDSKRAIPPGTKVPRRLPPSDEVPF